MEEIIIQQTALKLNIEQNKIKAVLDLLKQGNTVPFIARYRKEMTGALDEEAILKIAEAYNYALKLANRKEDIKRLIASQDKLSDELIKEIDKADKLVTLEDIFRPFQQKRKTRASQAKQLGLAPLADILLSLPTDFSEQDIAVYLNEEVKTCQDALQGAKDIIAEKVSDDIALRNGIRHNLKERSFIVTKKKKDACDPKETYRLYYDHREKTKYIEAHRIMAIDRAEKAKIISVSFEYDKEQFYEQALRYMTHNKQGATLIYLKEAINDGLERLLFPSIEREMRSELSEYAQNKSILVFSDNVEKLLLQAPLTGRTVLGFDPGYKHGCKLAVVDKTGKLLAVDKIFPFPFQGAKAKDGDKTKLLNLINKYDVKIIAIGNGTASRESELLCAEIIADNNLDVAYSLVSEAGASVYSAGRNARDEFPDLAVEERSAISIARRLLDPLAELIKIEPESIGVGQYQHDLPAKALHERLDFAVSKIVNRVGADLNTASLQLLMHISGLNKAIATNIIEYRNTHNIFKNRKELLEVKKLGPKAYEQAVGFLRIKDGEEELDMTPIHPESYSIARALLKDVGDLKIGSSALKEALHEIDIEKEAVKLNTDFYTLSDIISALQEPQRDYRSDYATPLLRKDILELKDLKIGDHIQGVVRNVVDFGAFVDIGLHDDGLIHRSKMGKDRNENVHDILSIGEIIETEVIDIDYVKAKVSLALVK